MALRLSQVPIVGVTGLVGCTLGSIALFEEYRECDQGHLRGAKEMINPAHLPWGQRDDQPCRHEQQLSTQHTVSVLAMNAAETQCKRTDRLTQCRLCCSTIRFDLATWILFPASALPMPIASFCCITRPTLVRHTCRASYYHNPK